ncbi:MAG: hypothetical protein U0I02_05635 [Eubacterium sp.]|nr:hypothetical protein [Eubacterium sp.]
MKKIISILLIICLLVAFSSCTISKNKEPTNPYQVTEKRTQIKENFDIDKINKITVTIGVNETEIKIDDELAALLEEANNTNNTSSEKLSTIAAFIKIYYNENAIDYGVIYLDSNANAFISSNYNKNENAVLKIENQSLITRLIFPNMNISNSKNTE